MSELDIFEDLEAVSGSNLKLNIIRSGSSNANFCALVKAALNYQVRYFIKKFDVMDECGTGDHFVEFMELLHRLSTRQVTGNQALMTVQRFFSKATLLEKKWYSRVLRQDLKVGCDVKTFIDGGIDIPLFEVMLAKDGKKTKKFPEMAKKGMWVSKKLDGYRCIAIIENGDATLYSRNGNAYENFPQIKESLERLFPTGDIVFDGEIMSDNFNAMQQSAFASTRGTAVGDVIYNIFDCIPHSEWITDSFKTAAGQRFANLKTLFDNKKITDADKLRMVEHEWIVGQQAMLDKEKEYVALGFEGAMCLPDIPYYRGKPSNKMLKLKTMHTQDCEITSIYEGRDDTKYVGTCGGVTVIQENGLICDVGSGFSDSERAYIWANQNKIIGRKIEVAYQELTPDNIMRFPVKKRWRNDK